MAISVSGLMSGLDTNSIISQLLDLERTPIVQLQAREADYQVKLTSYGTLQSSLNSLRSALQGMDRAKYLTQFSASSANTDLLTVSATSSERAGSYQVTVEQLAQVHKLTSAGFGAEEAVGEGLIRLTLGSGSTVEIAVGATDTITDVADAINEANLGIDATAIWNGSSYQITLSAQESGANNLIDITVVEAGLTEADPANQDNTGLSRLYYQGGNAGGFTQGGTGNLELHQEATNSIISVDGVQDIERSSNVIDDVIDGVTLTLKAAPGAPDNQTTVTLSRNTSTITSKVNAFISAYNNVLDFFNSYQGFDSETESAGVLLGDGTTNQIRSRLKSITNQMVPGINSNYDQLADLGITLNDEGHMEMDSATFNAALTENVDEVVGFFTNTETGAEGFAVRMVDALNDILNSNTGVLSQKKKGIQTSIDGIGERIERLEAKLVRSEERMRKQFNALELLLAQYQATGDYLTEQITSLQNLNKAISK